MPRSPPAAWLSAAVSAGYLPCLERFIRRMVSPACPYPMPLASRAPLVLELLNGRRLAALAAHGNVRQAAGLVATAVKVTANLAGQVAGGAYTKAAVECFVELPAALVGAAMECVAAGAEQQDQQQQEEGVQVLQVLSVCLARWLPLCRMLLLEARGEVLGLLVRARCRMVRLAELARSVAERRGEHEAAGSWGEVLAACRGMDAGKEGTVQGQDAVGLRGGEEGDGVSAPGLEGLAELLPSPYGVRQVLFPSCRNPLCTSLEGDSEAGAQLEAGCCLQCA